MAVAAGIHAATRSRARSLAPCEWTWPLLCPRSVDCEPDPSADDHSRYREALNRRQLITERLELKDSPRLIGLKSKSNATAIKQRPAAASSRSRQRDGNKTQTRRDHGHQEKEVHVKCLRSGARGKVRRGKCPSTTGKWASWGGWIRTTDYLIQSQVIEKSSAHASSGPNSKKRGERGRFKRGESGELPEKKVTLRLATLEAKRAVTPDRS
jgi:hypothetical protein